MSNPRLVMNDKYYRRRMAFLMFMQFKQLSGITWNDREYRQYIKWILNSNFYNQFHRLY